MIYQVLSSSFSNNDVCILYLILGTQKIVVVIVTCFMVVLVTITVTFVVVYLLSQKRYILLWQKSAEIIYLILHFQMEISITILL